MTFDINLREVAYVRMCEQSGDKVLQALASGDENVRQKYKPL